MRPVIAAAVWMVVTLGLGGLVTDIGPWYHALHKPPWQPPDWLFGPAWTLIFILAATAAVIAWNAPMGSPPERTALVLAYVANGVLNVTWSVLFFAMRRPDWALLEVSALWISIVVMIITVRALVPGAAWLLAPYLLWVTFASALNFSITRLNR
jgi:translocator protein